MALIAKDAGGDSNFEPCPTGVFHAVCVDVIDLGMSETPFVDKETNKKKWKHQIQIVWQVDAEEEDGLPSRRTDGTMHRLGKFYTLSLNEKANLRKDLEMWRGKAFTDQELEGWDVEQVIGVEASLNIIHKLDSKGNTRAQIAGVLPRPRKAPVLEPEEYTREMHVQGGRDTRSPKGEREKQRVPARAATPAPGVYNEPEDEGDEDLDLPF